MHQLLICNIALCFTTVACAAPAGDICRNQVWQSGMFCHTSSKATAGQQLAVYQQLLAQQTSLTSLLLLLMPPSAFECGHEMNSGLQPLRQASKHRVWLSCSNVRLTDLEEVLNEAQLIGRHNHAAPVAHGCDWQLQLSLCIPLHQSRVQSGLSLCSARNQNRQNYAFRRELTLVLMPRFLLA